MASRRPGLGAVDNPMARLAPPAMTPLASVMCEGESSSRAAVTPLSTAQHKHAAAIRSAPQRNSVLPDQPSNTPATTTSDVPVTTLVPMCSRKNTAATIVVKTNSRFSSNDAVAAGASARPVANSTGPTAPPTTTATASRRPLRRTAARDGIARPATGNTASAAPRYNRPANVNAPMSPASLDANGAEMPNRTAASTHRSTPRRLTGATCDAEHVTTPHPKSGPTAARIHATRGPTRRRSAADRASSRGRRRTSTAQAATPGRPCHRAERRRDHALARCTASDRPCRARRRDRRGPSG